MREAQGTRRDPAKAANRTLDQWAPAVDELTDIAGAAAFAGLSPASVRKMRLRRRADGTPEWPGRDKRFGRSDVWAYRTIVLHLAAAPGRGNRGDTGHRRRDGQDFAAGRAAFARTLQATTAEAPVAPAELARVSGLSHQTVHRYLTGLTGAGFAVQVAYGRYAAMPGAVIRRGLEEIRQR